MDIIPPRILLECAYLSPSRTARPPECFPFRLWGKKLGFLQHHRMTWPLCVAENSPISWCIHWNRERSISTILAHCFSPNIHLLFHYMIIVTETVQMDNILTEVTNFPRVKLLSPESKNACQKQLGDNGHFDCWQPTFLGTAEGKLGGHIGKEQAAGTKCQQEGFVLIATQSSLCSLMLTCI